jgi:acylphosphatase
MMMKKASTIKVYGKVQNVGFRYHTHKKALELNISGFVKNLQDGSVYIEAVGVEENIDHFILWCHKGPLWARVDHVSVQPMPVSDVKGFSVNS